jgi:hypothetical protein
MEKVAGDRRKFHTEEFVIYALQKILGVIISRRMRWEVHVSHVREIGNSEKFWPENLKREGSLGINRRRWEDNIRLHLGETWWEVEDWINIVQDREEWLAAVNTIINFRVP